MTAKSTYTIEIVEAGGANATLGLRENLPLEEFEKLVEAVGQTIEMYMLTRKAVSVASDAEVHVPATITCDAEVISAGE